MKGKSTIDSKPRSKNPFGHYRKRPDISEFRQHFELRDGGWVLREFLNNTATWVMHNFSPIELEIHQAKSLACAARENRQKLDYEKMRAQFPRLAILATDSDLKEIVEDNPKPKEVTAAMFSRVLHREESSIKRWARGKKE